MSEIFYWKPVERALEWTKVVLFRPFDFGKWLVLGFTAWLATLGQGGGGSFRFPEDDVTPDVRANLAEFWQAHMVPIILIGGSILILLLVISVVLLWLCSRGRFMFLENVLFNRALVRDPWRRWQAQGNALWGWTLVFSIVAILIAVLLIGGGVATGVIFFKGQEAGVAGIALLGVFIVLFFLFMLAALFILMLLNDFVVPLMMLHGSGVSAAWSLLWKIPYAFPRFLAYACIKILIGIIMGILVVLAGVLTCCCGFLLMILPYIGTVVLLPLFVFDRSFSVEFLRQFGPEYDVCRLAAPPVPPPPPPPPVMEAPPAPAAI